MSNHYATVIWERNTEEKFIDNTYSREHRWQFDGGATICASASPLIVPLPYSVEENVDPEEAFIASISSCHMLFFLSLAAKNQLVVNAYHDEAVGLMEKDEKGNVFISRVTLRPKITFDTPTPIESERLDKLHHESHALCFIANSVKTKIEVESRV